MCIMWFEDETKKCSNENCGHENYMWFLNTNENKCGACGQTIES